MKMNKKTIILCGLAILVIVTLLIASADSFFGWFGPKTLVVGNESDYKSIQQAIDAARDGDTIKVTASLSPYSGNLHINKSIKLVGENRNNTIIDGGGEGTCIYVTADNVHICNFTVQNGAWGIHIESSSKCVLKRNNMVNNTFYGLRVEGKYDNNIDQSNTINGKLIYYLHDIHGSSENPKIIENNELLGSIILGNCTHIIVRNNTIYNGDGIQLMDSFNNILKGNKLVNTLTPHHFREYINP